jgi:hypothetical protein|tara:strand:+ start:35259 stop:35447 length:189 start_codon:yes stop_codon:yes gene_type:complete
MIPLLGLDRGMCYRRRQVSWAVVIFDRTSGVRKAQAGGFGILRLGEVVGDGLELDWFYDAGR